MPLFDNQDVDQESELSKEDAARLQLHGHTVSDESGEVVTLPAKSILDEEAASSLKEAEKADEADEADESEADEADEFEADEADDTFTENEPKAEDGVTDLGPDGHAKEKSERGPANAADEGLGYAPTGL